MTIPAISGISAIGGASTVPSAVSAVRSPSTSGGSDFAAMLSRGLDSLQSTQATADHLAVGAATGDLSDIAQYTIAATQASLATQLATTLTSKGVEAFNDIMGMQA
jgi:flagellar hook-basal body complex protein FliE